MIDALTDILMPAVTLAIPTRPVEWIILALALLFAVYLVAVLVREFRQSCSECGRTRDVLFRMPDGRRLCPDCIEPKDDKIR